MTELTALLDGLDERVQTTLDTKPAVLEPEEFAAEDIPGAGARTWVKLPEVVAVLCDLKSSTLLGTGKHDSSTARIYEAAVGGAVKVLHDFDADFIDIQGDGGFGLFWGNQAFERALCAGVTIRTFSGSMVDRLEAKWDKDKLPETGYKVGIAAGRVLVKQVGTPRNPAEQEAIWAGKPVNYAAKCAQAADRHEIVVTGTVWDHFKNNDYIAYSCDCHEGPSASLWTDRTIDKLGNDDEKYGRVLQAPWCSTCGPEFCAAIQRGDTKREIPDTQRNKMNSLQMREANAKVAQQKREDLRHRRAGLRKVGR